MNSIGFGLGEFVVGGRVGLPIAHVLSDFWVPVLLGDELEVVMICTRIGTTSFTLFHEVLGWDGRERARVETVHVHVDTTTGSTTTLPEGLRQALLGDS